MSKIFKEHFTYYLFYIFNGIKFYFYTQSQAIKPQNTKKEHFNNVQHL